jgi:hypothetical protein
MSRGIICDYDYRFCRIDIVFIIIFVAGMVLRQYVSWECKGSDPYGEHRGRPFNFVVFLVVVVPLSVGTLHCITVSLSKYVICWLGRASSMLLECSHMYLCFILFLLGHHQYRYIVMADRAPATTRQSFHCNGRQL